MTGDTSGKTLLALAEQIAKAETKLAGFNEQLFWMTNGLKSDLPYQGLGSGLVDRYKREVLDPIWAKIHDIKTTEGERFQLVQQYRAEQEKILRLQEKQSKLDFLKEQMDLVKLVTDNGLNAENIFGGLTLGVNAEIDDLLAAISRAISQMIAKTEGELGIASPSKVMHRIGRFAMLGLTNGIKEASQGAIQAATRVTTGLIAGSATTSRNVSVAMGGVNIYNDMDAAMFDAQVRQTVRRAL